MFPDFGLEVVLQAGAGYVRLLAGEAAVRIRQANALFQALKQQMRIQFFYMQKASDKHLKPFVFLVLPNLRDNSYSLL